MNPAIGECLLTWPNHRRRQIWQPQHHHPRPGDARPCVVA